MEITLSFSSKKEYNKFMRNYNNGKGTNLSMKNCEIVHSGEGFGSFMKGVGKAGNVALSGARSVAGSQVGKALLKEGIRQGQTAATMAMMSRGVDPNTALALTNIGSQAANQGVDGMGFFSNLKSGAKSIASSNLGKNLGKMAVNEGFNQFNNQLAQRGYSNGLTDSISGLAQQAANNQINSYQGQGFGGDGLSQNIANMHSLRMKHARSFRGGSFRLN